MKRFLSFLLALAAVSVSAGLMIAASGGDIVSPAIAGSVCTDDGCVECVNCVDKFGVPTGQIKCRDRAGWYPTPATCCGPVQSDWDECHWPN